MYEILEHSADIGFRARASSLPELFERAAEALIGISLETELIDARECYAIDAQGGEDDTLLVNWLSEVLYYLDGKRLALRSFKVNSVSDGRVIAEAAGEPRDAVRHPARLVVKGITYHQLKLERDGEGWMCEVFVDV